MWMIERIRLFLSEKEEGRLGTYLGWEVVWTDGLAARSTLFTYLLAC